MLTVDRVSAAADFFEVGERSGGYYVPPGRRWIRHLPRTQEDQELAVHAAQAWTALLDSSSPARAPRCGGMSSADLIQMDLGIPPPLGLRMGQRQARAHPVVGGWSLKREPRCVRLGRAAEDDGARRDAREKRRRLGAPTPSSLSEAARALSATPQVDAA